MLEPLTELEMTLSYEKLSELLDDHPHVNYTDQHNTGITVYLKDQAVQRTPKGEPQKLRSLLPVSSRAPPFLSSILPLSAAQGGF